MEKPDKISLREAGVEVNKGSIKQRLTRQRKRLRFKYGLSKKSKEKKS